VWWGGKEAAVFKPMSPLLQAVFLFAMGALMIALSGLAPLLIPGILSILFGLLILRRAREPRKTD
jgi:hypothetical protein